LLAYDINKWARKNMNANSANQKTPNGPSIKKPIENSAAGDGGDRPKQQVGQVDQIARNLM